MSASSDLGSRKPNRISSMMRSCAALAVLVAVALCPVAQGRTALIGLSGDDTRHGIEVLYGNLAGKEVEVIRYHVDTLIQTRFARTVIEVEVRNNRAAQNTTVPFAIPENAMLVNFEIDGSDGKVHQARPMMRNAVVPESAHSSSKIQARNAEAFDVDLELIEYGSVVLRVVYEELLTRQREKYANVLQVWPGAVVADLKLSVRIKEASPINNVNYTFTTETVDRVIAASLDQLVSAGNVGDSEVRLTLQPSAAEQRALAGELGLDPDVGLAGQFRVEYDVARYPTAGDIVVRDGYFAHFFAPSELKALPKYALFLLDVSGSMGGRKIQQLSDAMVTILGQLGPDDLFTVIEFSDGNQMWDLGGTNGPRCKTYSAQYIPAAQQRARSMSAQGGTAMLGGLESAIDCAASGPDGLEPILVMLTDGIPNEPIDSIQAATAAANHPTGSSVDLVTSIFTLALGNDADANFLRELALRNGGTFQQIYEAADASVELQKFYESISSPLLTNVTVSFNYNQAVKLSITQKDFRTYFWGSELVVAGRIIPGQGDSLSGMVTATGYGGQAVEYPIQVSAQPSWQPEYLGGQANSERLWAFLFTKQKLDQEAIDGASSASASAAIDMALSYSYVTPHTCLVVDIINPYQAPTVAPPIFVPTTAPPAPTTIPPSGPSSPSPSSPSSPTVSPSSSSVSPSPPSTTSPPSTPSPSSSSSPSSSPSTSGPSSSPSPPTSPPGSPATPAPGKSGATNAVNIGSISIGSMTVNGPLIQFNLR